MDEKYLGGPRALHDCAHSQYENSILDKYITALKFFYVEPLLSVKSSLNWTCSQ